MKCGDSVMLTSQAHLVIFPDWKNKLIDHIYYFIGENEINWTHERWAGPLCGSSSRHGWGWIERMDERDWKWWEKKKEYKKYFKKE